MPPLMVTFQYSFAFKTCDGYRPKNLRAKICVVLRLCVGFFVSRQGQRLQRLWSRGYREGERDELQVLSDLCVVRHSLERTFNFLRSG